MSQVLNSPLEVGIRVVALLESLYPTRVDVSRLVLLDYAILHSSDFGGNPSLHPQIPARSGELGLKRELIHKGLQLMGARGLVDRVLTVQGIKYVASDDALPFLQSLESSYLDTLRDRCLWAANEFSPLSDEQMRSKFQDVFGQWAEEFHSSNGRVSGD